MLVTSGGGGIGEGLSDYAGGGGGGGRLQFSKADKTFIISYKSRNN